MRRVGQSSLTHASRRRRRDSSDDESDATDGEEEVAGPRGEERNRAGLGMGLGLGLGPWELMARGARGDGADTRLLLSAPCMLVKLKGTTPGHLEVRVEEGRGTAARCSNRCARSGPLFVKAKVRREVSKHETVVEGPWLRAAC